MTQKLEYDGDKRLSRFTFMIINNCFGNVHPYKKVINNILYTLLKKDANSKGLGVVRHF